jgi:hypothetical protein
MLNGSEASKRLAHQAPGIHTMPLPPFCAAKHPLGQLRATLATSQQFDGRKFRFFAARV